MRRLLIREIKTRSKGRTVWLEGLGWVGQKGINVSGEQIANARRTRELEGKDERCRHARGTGAALACASGWSPRGTKRSTVEGER